MYRTDLFAVGAAKRTLSLVDGFCAMIEAWNLGCARALLRMQIDTTLRFGAITLVEDQDAFVAAVLRDERIDKLKDRTGQRLTDAHLVETFRIDAPWLTEVYKRTSGYIHFSGQHIFSAVQGLDEANRSMTLGIRALDDHFPESSWLEVVDCFDETTLLFLSALGSWVHAKSSLPLPDGPDGQEPPAT